jgi:hypothetical protein
VSVIDTVRPASTLTSGDWSVVPSGTRHGVTSDNSDSTYVVDTVGADGRVLELNTSSHNVPANHQRHAIRIRVRGQSSGANTVQGSGTWAQRLGTGGSWTLTGSFSASLTSTLTTYTSSWTNANTLIASAANIFGVGYTLAPGQIDDPRVMELYFDIDNRARPDYNPDVLDAAGVSRDGGTVSDTNRPTLVFGSVAYDDLPALDWEVTVGGQTFSGSGTPPTSVQTNELSNGLHEAVFTVRSTIRGADPFEHEQSITFTVDFDIPPPPPPANLTATVVDGGIQVCWEDPGGQPWDDDFVYAEVYRSDCVSPDLLGLTLPGEDGSYAWTADKAQLDIVGDLDLAAELTHRTWRPEVVSAIVAKHTSASDERSYALSVRPSGQLEFGWSTDGTSANRIIVVSTVPVPFGETRRAVRATLDVNDGAGNHVVTFYTADEIDGSWTQLGDATTQVGVTSIYASTATLDVGASSGGTAFPLEAIVHRVQVRSGIGGTLVADPNFVDTLPGQTTLVDSVGNLWTVAGSAQLQAVPERLIAVISDGLTACYTDYTVPTTNGSPGCDPVSCLVSYRVRYVGTVSEVVEQPANIPSGFIVGWPSTVGSIPSGWSRVTALDGLFPRGSAATTSGATGGTASHQHTTPGHEHHINSHTHSVGGSTGSSNSSTTSARFNGASQQQADQPHTHTRAANTGSGGAATSGSASPATDSANNLPAYRDVIWIQSNGSPAAFTAGTLVYSAETVAGWADDASSSGRYLRGAGTGANGGATGGSNTHSHTVASHSHTGASHSHSLGNTGLSNPLSTIEAGDGSSQPEWLPRHTHPQTVGSSSTGSTNSSDGGVTDTVSLEPPNRRLRILANLAGGLQTRMIGLYRGDAGALPATMVRCDGSNGTPDMRDWFARERGADSLGTTGGATTHSHTTGSHSHTMSSHTHTTSVGASQTNSLERPSFGDLGDSPTVGHTHTSGNTGSTTPTTQTSASGSTDTVSHVPQYEDVHFVRLEGVSTVTGVAIPQIITSEIAEITIEAPTAFSDLLATESGSLEICPDSSYDLPRLQQRATPLVGGIPQASTTTHGRHRRLEFPVRDADVTAAEALLAMEYVWYAPLTEPAAWYAPSGWNVRPAAPGIKTFSVTLVRKDPPALTPGEELL